MQSSSQAIQIIEEKSLNAWACLQTVLYDGWILRFADGHTKRANSINPIYATKQDVFKKVQYCEELYLRKKLTPIFRITPLVDPATLDEILNQKGYQQHDITSVQLKDLTRFQVESTANIKTWAYVSDQWLECFLNCNHIPDQEVKVLIRMLQNIIPETCFAVLHHQNQNIACGLAVLEKSHVGLFEITTAKAYRRQGFGRALLISLLNWAKERGAHTAYLQVVLNNIPAVTLYSQLGFQELYQYFYRIKPIHLHS